MPARYVSARYVGREDAFGRLAAVLDDAAHGRARAMLVSGPAGVGISRFQKSTHSGRTATATWQTTGASFSKFQWRGTDRRRLSAKVCKP